MKISTVYSLLLISMFLFEKVNSYTSFEKIDYCTSSNQSVQIELCKLENKKFSGIFVITKPLNKVNLITNFYREENSKFRQIFKAPQIEWCSMVGNGKGKSNTLVKVFILPVLKKNGFSLECPLQGIINIFNISIEQKMTTIFPNGLYRVSVKAYNSDDKDITNFSIILKVEP
ncbi:hypothetical protein ACKWTF_013944 [Chironomus riparius]